MATLTDATKQSFFDNLACKKKYDDTIRTYKTWISKEQKQETALSVLEFIQSCQTTYAPSTLWVIFSILNKYFKVYHNTRLNDCVLLIDWLKSNEKKHKPKKSAVLTQDDIENFLVRGEDSLLMEKVASVIAIHGLLRISELVDLTFEDVKKEGESYRIFLRKSKTDQRGQGFYFLVTGEHVSYVEQYISQFEAKEGRFFRRLNEAGKGTARVCGKNYLAKIPSMIASFNSIPQPNRFTGHCFRRTGATKLADEGCSLMTLKRAGRWTSDAVVTGYVEVSKKSKMDISEAICNEPRKHQTTGEGSVVKNITFNNCSNIVFHC